MDKHSSPITEILASRDSIQHYEDKSLKAVLPQMFAAVSAASYHLVGGMCLSYSAILIPQLFDEQQTANSTSQGINIDKESASWIASVLMVIMIPSALFGGLLIDNVGRLHSIRLSLVPTIVGSIMIAISRSMLMLITGRILTGIPIPWGTGSGAAYITEISSPHLRGALISLNSFFLSLGFLIVYLSGSVLHWRTVSWMCAALSLLPLFLLLFLPESPSWLMMKGHNNQALRSLAWFNRFQNAALTKIQFDLEQQSALLKKQESNNTKRNIKSVKETAKLFLEPTCYKPLVIILGAFFFQQFSGIYMTMVYAVNYMQDVGANANPYTASIYLGAGRFAASIINVWLFRYCYKRHLLFAGTLGMAITMIISGMCTKWIHQGNPTYNYMSIAMPVLYVVFSSIALMPLPFIYSAELFPLKVRGIAQSVVQSYSYIVIFAAIKSYFTLEDLFGGASGLQYYFAAMSFGAFIFCFVFVPETHKKKLCEIEEHFRNNFIFVKKQNKSSKRISLEEVVS